MAFHRSPTLQSRVLPSKTVGLLEPVPTRTLETEKTSDPRTETERPNETQTRSTSRRGPGTPSGRRRSTYRIGGLGLSHCSFSQKRLHLCVLKFSLRPSSLSLFPLHCRLNLATPTPGSLRPSKPSTFSIPCLRGAVEDFPWSGSYGTAVGDSGRSLKTGGLDILRHNELRWLRG